MRPVVQIAIMVTIVFVLACVLAAFVYGMAGNLQKSAPTTAPPIREEVFKVIEKVKDGDSYFIIKNYGSGHLPVTKEDYQYIEVGRIYTFEVYWDGITQLYKVELWGQK